MTTRHDGIHDKLQALIDASIIADYEANNPGGGKRWILVPMPGTYLWPHVFSTAQIEIWLSGVQYARERLR